MAIVFIPGMFQRVDKLRKNAFASVCVFGEDKANNISGIWVWRGQELAFPVSSRFWYLLQLGNLNVFNSRIDPLFPSPTGGLEESKPFQCYIIIFQQCEDWTIDYESYDWKKLDPTSDETKKLVDQYFKWIGEDNKGRKFNQGKIFK